LGYFLAIPSIVFPALLMLLVAAWVWPVALFRATGGERPVPPDVEAVFSKVNQASERLEVGDVEGAADDAARLNSIRTPVTDRYIDLWQRFVGEEQARRSGKRESSRTTLKDIREEAERLWAPNTRPAPRLSLAVVGLAAIIGASPALVDARAYIGVELVLPTMAETAVSEPLPLERALLSEPEPGATIIHEEPMDLDAAAESRHDPDTRDQLIEAGFVAAHARAWLAADGRVISADVFVFRDGAGALSFHRNVNRYACQFSNEAFAGPVNGVGLQVRRSNGDPIQEQITWVSGARRYAVSVYALAPPGDHQRVQRLAERAVQIIGG
jgi:hypothetical protein